MFARIKYLIIRLQKYIAQRREIDYLRSLNDRELRDMGLTRYDVEQLVNQGRPEEAFLPMMTNAAQKFDPVRANEYEVQSRIALAGYDACHELSACVLAAALGSGSLAQILVVGAGGGAREIVTAGALEPHWRFMAVDPSQVMMDVSIRRLKDAGFLGRTEVHVGYVDDLPHERHFDAATLIGVLHHLPGDGAKRAMLGSLAARLKTGAPFVLAGNRHAYASRPLFLAAWAERWRMHGATAEEIKAKHGTILEGADPVISDDAVVELLVHAGFEQPALFFSSLFWGAWIARRGKRLGDRE